MVMSTTVGLVVGRAIMVGKKLEDYTVNHVPPESVDIANIDTERLEKELHSDLLNIANELDWKEGQEILLFIEYSKESALR